MNLRQGCCLVLLAAALQGAGMAAAQEQGGAPTVRVVTRLVVEDVLVMDAHGNPVHGLPASSFHVLDEGKPQHVLSFEEGSPAQESQQTVAPLPPGTFSNAVTPAATTEVLLIDADDMELTDQMFLGVQLRQSLGALPPDLPVAVISVRNGRVIPVMAATTDRAALERVVAEVVPVQTHAIDSKFQSAVNQLMSVAALLQQTRGRKNLIWFAGEFPLVSAGNGEQEPGGLQVNYSQRENDIHQVQEALAEARVSVYPVDVRGVITVGMAVGGADVSGISSSAAAGRDPRAVNQASQKREVAGPGPATIADQRREMRVLAEVTGGRAYMLNNLADEIGQAFDLGKSAYTLAYVPSPYSTDQSFHRVTIAVDGGYAVSYRKGYLATFTGSPEEASPRARLTADGVKTIDPAQNRPLVFQVKLATRGDAQHVTLNFSIPLAELKQEHTQGVWSSKLLLSIYAYDPNGRVRDGKVQELNTALTDPQYQEATGHQKRVGAKENLALPKGAKYLLVIARDQDSQRTGSLLLQTRLLASLPLTAEEPDRPQSSAGPPSGH